MKIDFEAGDLIPEAEAHRNATGLHVHIGIVAPGRDQCAERADQQPLIDEPPHPWIVDQRSVHGTSFCPTDQPPGRCCRTDAFRASCPCLADIGRPPGRIADFISTRSCAGREGFEGDSALACPSRLSSRSRAQSIATGPAVAGRLEMSLQAVEKIESADGNGAPPDKSKPRGATPPAGNARTAAPRSCAERRPPSERQPGSPNYHMSSATRASSDMRL